MTKNKNDVNTQYDDSSNQKYDDSSNQNLKNQNSSQKERKKVSIALQGGGAHGAFAWGVMDKLLEDDRFEILGVSGTSAGAMNAASIIQGLTKSGSAEARATLKDYWLTMNKLSSKASPYKNTYFDKLTKYYNLDRAPGYWMMEAMQFFLSPYDFNPSKVNPFSEFLRDFFDFESIRNSDRGIFLGATEVQTGKIKIFSNNEFSYDALMASACLPFLYHAVQVDGKYYWDGGFIANPAIFPLIDGCDCTDIIIIQLRRMKCEKLPTTRGEINDRLKEITFNGCLVREMRSIRLLTRLIDDGIIRDGAMKRMNIHIIRNEDAFKGLNMSSALNTELDFIQMLHDEGVKTAERWIGEHYVDIASKVRVPEVEQFMFSDFS